MRKFLIFILTSSVSLSALAQPSTDQRLQGLDTFALRLLKEWDAPGVTIAVVEKNKVLYTGGFGYSDYEKKIPVTENTQFAIGSCTKAFTASMLGMLEKEGNLSLDKPVREYLPELIFKNEYTNKYATLRDLMCHRTGLPRHDFSWEGSTATRSELLSRVQHHEPSAELREKFQYNNFMFLALGMVIEKLTGKSWEENIEVRILKPLGMNNTNTSVVDMENSADHALAYTTENNKPKKIPYHNIDAIGPAGSINSCAKDMAKWLITWVNDGKYNGSEIIPAGYRSQAITAQITTGEGLPGIENPDVHMSDYGLGWFISSYRGHYRVEHGGGIDGFVSSTGFFPSDSIGIFVATNQGTPTTSIRNFIADRMLRLSYRPWGKTSLSDKLEADSIAKVEPNNDSLNQKSGTTLSHNLREYTGVYENKGYGQMKFFIEGDTLWADYNESGKRTTSYLQHYHFDTFRVRSTDETVESRNAAKVKFNTDFKGEITSLEVVLEPSVKDIVFEKMRPSLKIGKNDLRKYVGDYDFGGVTIEVYIRGENTLMMLVPGQPDYDLVPTESHQFDLKILKGYSVKFDVDDKNVVTAFSSIQPNGIFKANRKK